MDEAMKDRLAAYINGMEESICGEFHGANWPNCDDPSEFTGHGEGRALLAVVNRLPTSVD